MRKLIHKLIKDTVRGLANKIGKLILGGYFLSRTTDFDVDVIYCTGK